MLPSAQSNFQDSTSDQDSDNFAVSPTSISTPKGGAAIRGIGEKFAANLMSGKGFMSLPITARGGLASFLNYRFLTTPSRGMGFLVLVGAYRSRPLLIKNIRFYPKL